MLSTLLTSLTSLRDFLSRAFFIAAFVPALLFVFINALILYIWNWPAHVWLTTALLEAKGVNQLIVFAGLFFFIWISAYLVSSLTPLWTRTLEGANWWPRLRDAGAKFHQKRFRSLTNQITEAVGIYARIELRRPQWKTKVQAAIDGPQPAPGISLPSPLTGARVQALKVRQGRNEMLTLDEVAGLANAQIAQIQVQGNTEELQELAGDIELLMDYAVARARSQHLRSMNQRNLEFSDQEDIAPTRFGNVGLTAQAYGVRAFGCNLTRIWSALRHVAEKEEATGKALENTKSQLDFLVAGFWLSLTLSVEWACIFAFGGEWKGALASALAGPFICWAWWYGAAVEQYRVLQDLIMSSLNAFRLQVLTDLRLGLPIDLTEERDLWRLVDQAIGNGDPLPLRYQHPRPSP
jgi:hypothetical protein